MKHIPVFLILLPIVFFVFCVKAEEGLDFSALPPTKTQPQTPLSFLLSPFNDGKIREAMFQEQDRFKLLHKELPFRNWIDSSLEYEQVKEYSKRMARMFLKAVKENLQEKMRDHLEEDRGKENPFSKIVDLIKETKKITDHIQKQLPQRNIAVSVKPDLETPSIKFTHFLFDQTQISYNILLKSPTFSVEQNFSPILSSQLYYQPLFKTLDSALKGKINTQMNFHMIHRNQFIHESNEKSLIFGLSIDVD